MPYDEDDPFYLSDLMSELDEKIPFDMMGIMQAMKYPLAVLCIETSGEESLYAGHVKNVSYKALEIENFDERQVTLPLGGTDFCVLRRDQAPASLKAITTDAYEEGMQFDSGKRNCYLLARMSKLGTPGTPSKVVV
jgi:hypothetical protein